MGTRYQGTAEEARALNTYIKLMRAADSVTARIHRHLAPTGLTLSQLGVLDALFHLGPLCQRDLAQKLLKTGGNITLVIDNLEKRALVKRERQTADRRFVLVSLTEQGQQLFSAIFPRHVAAIVQEMGQLTAAEQEALARLCRQLGRAECLEG